MKRIAELMLSHVNKKAVPAQYLCPITHEIMVNPVQASDGWTYECSAISRWCEDNETSPLDPSTHIEIGNLKPNRALRDVIELMINSGEMDESICAEWKESAEKIESAAQLFRDGRIEESAVLGYARAQGELSQRYYQGIGVMQDLRTSIKWALKAAIGGDGPGQFRMGYAHHLGEGASKDWRIALKYYVLAFDNGQSVASSNIGEMYRIGGFGLQKNISKMFEWCQQNSTASSLYLVGMCYYTGDGVEQNHTEARKSFKMSAVGNVESQYMLGKMMIQGEGGISTLDGVKYIDRAAKQGHPAAREIKDRIIAATRV